MKCCINNYGEGLKGWGLGGLKFIRFVFVVVVVVLGYAVHITILFVIVLESNDYLSIIIVYTYAS